MNFGMKSEIDHSYDSGAETLLYDKENKSGYKG